MLESLSTPRRRWTTVLNQSGRTTMPAAIRRHLGVGPGDHIEWIVTADGHVHVKVAHPANAHPGRPSKPRPELEHPGAARRIKES